MMICSQVGMKAYDIIILELISDPSTSLKNVLNNWWLIVADGDHPSIDHPHRRGTKKVYMSINL